MFLWYYLNMKKFIDKFGKIKFIVSVVLFILLMVSLIAGKQIEFFLSLKPDLTEISKDAFEIHFVDVGQGDATLIKLPDGKTMMVDFAPESSYPKLREYIDNIFFADSDKKFDYIILTHSDADHIGGMKNVLDQYNVDNVYYSLDLVDGGNREICDKILELEKDGEIISKVNKAGNEIVGENYIITWLTPNREVYKDTNDFSPVILFEFEDFSFILSGDATSEVGEREAMNYFLGNKDIDILKLGHHGSNTSTSIQFLEAFTPEIAIVSNGTTYGHPSSETIETLATYDNLYNKNMADYFSTHEKGNIIVTDKGINFIANVFDYIFVPYWLIVLVLVIVLMVNALIPRRIHREEWLKMRARKLKRLKKKKIDKNDILGTI